jgi:putative hemolysin
MQIEAARSACDRSRYAVRLAGSVSEVEAAQRLRWQVFAGEQGARLHSPTPGVDIDPLDRYCDHLTVTDLGEGKVIGTYRLLSADVARRCGGYYSEREFQMGRVLANGGRLLELGRACVHPRHRNGAVIALLWSGLAGYLVRSRHNGLIGCASIPLGDDEAAGAALAMSLVGMYPARHELRVTPRRRLTIEPGEHPAALPPLVKGYLRSGARICGEPFWDTDFACADLLIHLDADQISERYARRFLGPVRAE